MKDINGKSIKYGDKVIFLDRHSVKLRSGFVEKLCSQKIKIRPIDKGQCSLWPRYSLPENCAVIAG